MPEGSPEAPAPEVLQPQDDAAEAAAEGGATATDPAGGAPGDGKKSDEKTGKKRRLTYRPSHKATFIGLGVVVAILVLNAAIFFFLLRGGDTNNTQRENVVISSEDLAKLGVNRSSVGSLGTELIVGPDARFNGKVTVASDVDIAGNLTLNSKFSATGASLTSLQAGVTSLEQLNVNGDTTLTNLSVRKNLSVAGITQLQGAVTVNNNMNVIGNLTVGGAIFAGSFQATNLISGSTLTVGGHIITKGPAPSVSAGGGVGSNGTVSISGNDAAGTVAINAGSGAGSGTLATITFHSDFSATPHVIVTPIGHSISGYYVNRSSNGFSIVASGAISAGGYAFDYIVMQ